MIQSLVDITDRELDALLKSQAMPVLVEFHLPGCRYCAQLEPLLADAAQTHAQRVTIVRLDASTNQTRPHYGLSGTPTLVLYIDGEEHVTKTGTMREQKLRAFLNAYL